ncbi:endonuclease Q family protein [Cohnella terricola]|uniref:TIGR00375 family protein n=1 Tax=Cohnella terricola TaxID=1289167 RepID=A0A559JXP7_9BACL|nr:endonuclease Q family protein [Cohnella terricola]TVY04659.1 TIGR00375 family protein [Cohnella terricola]
MKKREGQETNGLSPCFADLHVHIGRSQDGQPVKISGSKDLTFRNIAKEAYERKGIELIGIIDCHSPAVQKDIMDCLHSGEMEEIEGGGIRYGGTTIVLGTEMELKEEGGGPFHLLGYLPDLHAMLEWTAWMAPRVTNVNLSSQRIRVPARELQDELLARGGLLVPAHVFTPHRGLLGCSADRLADRLDPEGIAAIELGLSADTDMAGYLSELDRYPFLTNSDAHSTGMIGRECNELLLSEPSFAEFAKVLKGADGRKIVANYGLHPELGKYHTTYCNACRKAVTKAEETSGVCPFCGSVKLTRGVSERISQLADRERSVLIDGRPPYRQQVPLSFFPGLGPAKRERLFAEVGTEMDVLHRISRDEIAPVTGEKIADLIVDARDGLLSFSSGSGGSYGSIRRS